MGYLKIASQNSSNLHNQNRIDRTKNKVEFTDWSQINRKFGCIKILIFRQRVYQQKPCIRKENYLEKEYQKYYNLYLLLDCSPVQSQEYLLPDSCNSRNLCCSGHSVSMTRLIISLSSILYQSQKSCQSF